jgi:hypothetical protein
VQMRNHFDQPDIIKGEGELGRRDAGPTCRTKEGRRWQKRSRKATTKNEFFAGVIGCQPRPLTESQPAY